MKEKQFLQPKRELYGLMRALQASRYWLLGCRKLIVEMDAKYLKGMLSNPGIAPNATIMYYVEDVLIYHFTLCYVPGKTFSMDGLLRRMKQPDNEKYGEVNSDLVDYLKIIEFEYSDQLNNEKGWQAQVPLELEEFADEVDTRGGYLVAEKVEDFARELQQARDREDELWEAVDSQVQAGKIRLDSVAVLALSTHLLPEPNTGNNLEEY